MLNLNMFSQEDINITNIQIEGGIILVEIFSTKDYSYCPRCNRKSNRIHSRYSRTLRNFIKDFKDEKYNIYLSENPEYKVQKIQRKKMMTLLFCLPEKLSDKQKEQLEKILEDKTLNKLYILVQSFRIIVKERKILELEAWIDSALSSEIKELSIFAQGLQSDIECIKNALIYTYSNGILEGNVNRLKMIKRMMYGRAGYRLLSKKISYSFN